MPFRPMLVIVAQVFGCGAIDGLRPSEFSVVAAGYEGEERSSWNA
jgi:hypothetical protein